MKLFSAAASLLLLAASASATVFFSEDFNDGWESRWVASKFKGAEAGKFGVSAGKYFGDAEAEKGLQTQENARFYQISAAFPEFSNKDKDVIIQYSVKHEQNIDCGGGYIKLLPAGLDQENFNGDSVYNIMFGPDICGATKRVHVIFNYKGQNYLLKKEIKAESDIYTHVYTLIVSPNQTYKVLIDNKEVRTGSLFEDWDFLPPKEIKDPNISKPADWVDAKEIADPSASKPEGWDDIPAQIQDPDAAKPEDWDDELDGEWTAPLISNPEYKGEWKAPMIPNPEYKGEWVHPLIPNPDYAEDKTIGLYDSFANVGIEVWQVKSGTIFDNFLITDDASLAQEWAARGDAAREAEKKAKEAEKKAEKPEEEEDAFTEEDLVDVNDEDELALDDMTPEELVKTYEPHDHHDEL